MTDLFSSEGDKKLRSEDNEMIFQSAKRKRKTVNPGNLDK